VIGDIFLLELLHHKYPIIADKTYGAINKYKMAVFKFEAIWLLPFETVLSTVILHIAH